MACIGQWITIFAIVWLACAVWFTANWIFTWIMLPYDDWTIELSLIAFVNEARKPFCSRIRVYLHAGIPSRRNLRFRCCIKIIVRHNKKADRFRAVMRRLRTGLRKIGYRQSGKKSCLPYWMVFDQGDSIRRREAFFKNFFSYFQDRQKQV